MSGCPHLDGMAPVNAGDILHIFDHMSLHPELYQLSDWPQLFFVCRQCGDKAPDHYDRLSWEQAIAWAKEYEHG